MGLSRLLGFCLAFLPVLALAAGPVSTEVAAGTTTYRITGQTLNVPRISQMSHSKDITPRIQKLEVGPVYRDGGLGQTASGRLIIATPEESATARISGRFNVSGAGLKFALKRAAAAATGAGLVIGAYELGSAIHSVLDQTDWVMLENGDLMRPYYPDDELPPSGDTIYWSGRDVEIVPLDDFPQTRPEWATTPNPQSGRIQKVATGIDELPPWTQREVRDVFPCSELQGWYYGSGIYADQCIMLAKDTIASGLRVVALVAAAQSEQWAGSAIDYLYSPWYVGIRDGWQSMNFNYSTSRMWSIKSFPLDETDPNPPSEPQLIPVTPAEFDAAVDSFYDPEPSDWEVLFPHFPPSEPSTFHVNEPIPMDQPAPEIKTETIEDDTYVTETSVNYDPSVSGNNTWQPSISLQRGESYQKYLNGVLVGSGSTQQDFRPGTPSPAPDPGDGSGDGSGGMFPDFCTWARPLCDWLDWTREPLDDDLDLSQIVADEDFEQSYNFSFGNSSCPEPISINIAFLNRNVDLSYEPACDLASYAKPLVLISAYIFAIYIGLGVVRNG